MRGMNKCCSHIALLARPFTHFLPARIQWLTRSKPETTIGVVSGGYLLLEQSNDCLTIGSYVFGLNSELFLHTDKKQHFFF